jgi:serine/threonine protein phosphatase PrpC
VCVDRPGRDLWVAHVGDSDVCLVDLGGQGGQGGQGGGHSRQATALTEDHSPLSKAEFLRMVALCPTAHFEFDRQRKDAPPLHIYAASADAPGGWQRNPVPTRNVYYKNRANELATYVSEAGGYSSLANTRAIGDFRMKRAVGLSAAPFVARHPPLAPSQRLVLASDGFWDSWPVEELLRFCEERRDFCAVVEELERTHVAVTNKYFGSCSDDTFLFFVQPCDPNPNPPPS